MSIDGALRGAGLPVPEAQQFCVNCRELGHACPAQRGVDLCVFCEDGEPCPVTAAEARTATQAEKNKPAAPPIKPKAPKAARAEKQKENAMEQQKLCKCGCGQEIHSPVRDYARGHRPTDEKGKVACPECKKELSRNSLYSHMPAKHQWTGEQVSEYFKKRGNGVSPSAPKAKPKAKFSTPNGHTTPPSELAARAKSLVSIDDEGREAVATICVTEGALNRWWAALPVELKANAFTSVMGAEN